MKTRKSVAIASCIKIIQYVKHLHYLLLSGVVLTTVLVVSGCAGISSTLSTSLTTTCTNLAGKTINDVTITSTKWFEASGGNPAFCQVNATRAPYLDIEIDVPENWSGRLWQQGGGGLDGKITSAITSDAVTGAITDVNIALKDGLSVYAASNGGNRASVPAQAAPFVWANGTLDGVASAEDYAYAALNTTREFAKAVIKKSYGKLPDHTYFNGCSNGGRNAYIAADRWPEEYDGIVSGCMGMDLTGQTVGWLNLGSRVGTPAMPSFDQWTAVTTAAVKKCDAQDGVTNGIIANQSACNFDVTTLQCGQPTADPNPVICLTAAQVQTVKDVTSDVKLADNTTVYSGFTWASWAPYIPGWGLLGGGNAILATGDPAWFTQPKQQSFNLGHDYPIFQYGFRIAGADPDKRKVAAFVASGKKLISWHDGSDNLVSINDHVRNYSTMTNIAKGLGLTNPLTNTRFFVVPGGSHTEGQTLMEVNWFSAITNWVELNIAPEQLIYNRRDKITGIVLRTLPVCRHPQYPRYNGAGDVNSSASYTCTNP
jgi:feruloyl esterase